MKRYISKYILLGIVSISALHISCSDDPIPLRDPSNTTVEIDYTWSSTADSMQLATYNAFLGSNGTFVQDNAGNSRFNYWPNSHVLHVLVDGYIRTDDASY